MASSKAKLTSADTTAAVDTFMAALEHPFKLVVAEIRKLICATDPAVAEGIKWNAPSFRTTEYFATTNLREKSGVGVILHLGAKVRALPDDGLLIDDPSKLLKWLAKDRAAIVFSDLSDFKQKSADFERVIRQWLLHV